MGDACAGVRMARMVLSATGLPAAPQEGHAACAGLSKEALRDVGEGPETDSEDRGDPQQRPAEPAGFRVLAAAIVALCGLGLAIGEPEANTEQPKGGGGEDRTVRLESGEQAGAADPDRREDERAETAGRREQARHDCAGHREGGEFAGAGASGW